MKAIDPEVYVRIEHIDGTEIAFNRADSIVKNGDPRFIVEGAYPYNFTSVGQLGITVLVDNAPEK